MDVMEAAEEQATQALDQQEARRPLRRDAERNRERILLAAAEVFSARGLDASLDDIARQAGVGVGTVYRRFPDKESLVAELFTSKLDTMVGHAEHALHSPDPWTGLAECLEQIAETFSSDLGLRQMLMFGTYGSDRVSAARERMVPIVSALLKRAQAAGQVRGDLDPTDVPFIGLMLGLIAQYAGDIRPDIWRRYLTLILDGLRPQRSGTTALPVPALDPTEMESLIRTQAGRATRRTK
jgi:AcrR family transcriptional regulator